MTDSHTHYHNIATKYDNLWTHSNRYVDEMADAIALHLRLRSYHRLADVGGGTGLYARRLRDLVGLTLPVIVCDPSEAMLENIRGEPGIVSRAETAEEFATGDHVVDRILLKEAVHHFDDVSGTVVKLAERLGPDGRMLVVMLPPTIDYPLFSAALRLYEKLQPHYGVVVEAMRSASLVCRVSMVSIDIHIERDRYLELVANRYMSVLSEFDDDALEAGLAEMRARLSCEQLTIPDRFVFICGSRNSV